MKKNDDILMKNINYLSKAEPGLSKKIIEEISYSKSEPNWMRELRLKALEYFIQRPNPNFGVDISTLDLDSIVNYVRPNSKRERSWEDVPEEIRENFEKLGIPEAERKSLAGVGAQYDSEMVYHNMKEFLSKLGVIFLDMDSAIKQYPDLVKKYFMHLIPPNDHKFAALHGAVWSGGTFVYVPENVNVPLPIQSYYLMGSPGMGQFEHTLIVVDKGAHFEFIEGCSGQNYSISNLHAGAVEIYVEEGATIKFSTIENWAKNTYNLNTKRASIDKDGTIIWISGTMGSAKTMLYPSSILKGKGARAEYTTIAYAGQGQHLDTGTKVFHLAPYTSSKVDSRSISFGGGYSFYRGLVKVSESAIHSKSSVDCSALMVDDISKSDTLPIIEVMNNESDIAHEAYVGRINEDQIYYLMSRGLTEDDARALIVRGFLDPFIKQMPFEYAVEFNRLIDMHFNSKIG
jgi:Fe-S cluster assembly protein SufB